MFAQRKGEYISVKIDDALVNQEVNNLKHSLIGKLSLAPGDKPYSVSELVSKLNQIWGVAGEWTHIPLGRGYYNIQLPGPADTERILNKRMWNLKPGNIRVQRWIHEFNPYKVNSNMAQVWVRIFELPIEFYQPKNNTRFSVYFGFGC